MARIPSGAVVTALTTAALAVIGVLAWQASAAPDRLAGHAATPPVAVHARPSATPQPTALPGGSGSGKRAVYSLGEKRVWLVDAGGRVAGTFAVAPETVSPPPGRYAVTHKYAKVTGTDGVPIENVVLFAVVGGVPIGFSSAVDGSMPTPDPAVKAGGIRESPGDGAAMWAFTASGTPVVVVP